MEPVDNDSNRITASIEQNQRDIQRARRELREYDSKLESGTLHTRVLGVVVVVLVLGLAGACWYGYAFIASHNADLAQLSGLKKLASATDGRLTSTEGKVNNWASDQASLRDRMAQLETALRSNVTAARGQTEAAASLAARRIREEIHQSLARLESRVANVESVQHETHDQLAAAQTEIGSLRQQIAGLQQQNTERTSDLERTQADVDRLNGQLKTMNNQVKTMNDQVQTHTAGLKDLNNQVDRERKSFELSTSKTQQVAPQIYLTVSHTDVAHQKVDGWMQFADEGRIVWIHGLGAQHALTFVTRSDNRTHELVFTGIQGTGATGYLLLPSAGESSVASAN